MAPLFFQYLKTIHTLKIIYVSIISFVQVQQKLGYCPQFDALIEQMTVRETLAMFARLRGIDEKQIPRVVVMLVTNLLLQDHIDKQCGDLRWVKEQTNWS